MAGWQFEEPNPIKRCAIQLGLAWPLQPGSLREISGMHNQFKRELPRKIEQQALTIQVGGVPGPASLPPTPTPDIGGVIFDFVNPIGHPSQGLVVGPSLINYYTTTYTRWAEFWPFAHRLITAVCEKALNAAPLTSITLEYHDQFDWTEAGERLDLRQLFKTDHEYLGTRFLSRHEGCHTFQGWIEHSPETPEKQLIHNLNVSLRESSQGSFICLIIISHRTQFNIGLDLSTFNKIVEKTLLDMRTADKEILNSLLQTEILTRIPGLRS